MQNYFSNSKLVILVTKMCEYGRAVTPLMKILYVNVRGVYIRGPFRAVSVICETVLRNYISN